MQILSVYDAVEQLLKETKVLTPTSVLWPYA